MKMLRPYQNDAGAGLWAWLMAAKGNPLVVAPVGAGKSLLIADFIREVHTRYPRTKIIMLTHVKELLEQDSAELLEYYPSADICFYCAALKQKRLHADIVFASIQSIHNKVAHLNRPPEIIIIDEAHLLSHNESTQYRKFIDAAKAINPNCVTVGFTGTPYRADTGRLDEGEGKLFDGIAYEISIAWMIEQGYLVAPIAPSVKTVMNADGVGSRNGDYIAGQLERAVNIPYITDACCDEVVAIGREAGRKRWFGMTAGVGHCKEVLDALVVRGMNCRSITGNTPKDERRDTIGWFKEISDDVRILLNVGTLNVGFNCPHIDLLFPMRPTRSSVLYMQYTGRGLRPVYAQGFDLETQEGRLAAIAASPKPDCLFVDFGGIINGLGPIDMQDVRKNKKEEKGDGDAPFKWCPQCEEKGVATKCATAQKYCYVCNYHFAAHSVDRNAAKEVALLSTDAPPLWHDVIDVSYEQFQGKTHRMMRVTYTCQGGRFFEYVCCEHPDGSYPKKKAAQWFKTHGDSVGSELATDAVDMQDHYLVPARIQVMRQKGNPKYFEVINVQFVKQQEPEKSLEELLDDLIPF